MGSILRGKTNSYPDAAELSGSESIPMGQGSGVFLASPGQVAAFVTGAGAARADLANVAGPQFGAKAFAAAGASTPRPLSDRFADLLCPEDFGAAGDASATPGSGSDDTAALQAWIDYLVAHGRKGCLRGYYRTGSLAIAGGVHIEGVGRGRCGLVQSETVSLNSKGTLYANSGSATARLGPFTFRDFDLIGDVTGLGFEQFTHLMSLHGVEDVLIEAVRFLGFRGDGLYLGSGIGGADERHNVNVKVLGCTFDGVNKDNRNGISVLDVDGMLVQQSWFANVTKSGMPGAMEFEPNPGSTFAVLRNVRVQGNTFENIGGNVAAVGVVVSASIPLPTNFQIVSNTFRDTAFSCVYIQTGRVLTSADADQDIKLSDNRGVGGRFPFLVLGGKGIEFRNNLWTDFSGPGVLGGDVPAQDNHRIIISDEFVRVGQSANPQGLVVRGVNFLDLTGSRFVDCGNLDPGNCAIYFSGTAKVSSFVTLNDIEIIAPNGKTNYAIRKASGHSFTPATNQFFRPRIAISGNDFQSYRSDTLWSDYVPVVFGATSSGTGSYSVQTGKFRVDNSCVEFWGHVVQTAHTGTGPTYISAPSSAIVGSAVGSPAWLAADLWATGLGNGATARFNTGANRLQIHDDTTSRTPLSVPPGAAEYVFSGRFRVS